jgi:hypothetical protein
MSFLGGFLLETNLEKQATAEKIEFQKFKLRLFKENLTKLRIYINKQLISSFLDSKVVLYDYKSTVQKKNMYLSI